MQHAVQQRSQFAPRKPPTAVDMLETIRPALQRVSQWLSTDLVGLSRQPAIKDGWRWNGGQWHVRFERAGHEGFWLLTPKAAFFPSIKTTKHIVWSHPDGLGNKGGLQPMLALCKAPLQKIDFDVVHIHHLNGLPLNGIGSY